MTGTVFQPCVYFRKRVYLALVAVQCSQFDIKGFGDIGTEITVFRGPEQDLFYLVWLQAFGQQVRVGIKVPGVRKILVP